MEYLNEIGIPLLEWLLRNQDFNPIHLWNILGLRLRLLLSTNALGKNLEKDIDVQL